MFLACVGPQTPGSSASVDSRTGTQISDPVVSFVHSIHVGGGEVCECRHIYTLCVTRAWVFVTSGLGATKTGHIVLHRALSVHPPNWRTPREGKYIHSLLEFVRGGGVDQAADTHADS